MSSQHFWIVAGDESRWYSSASGGYVSPASPEATAFKARGGKPSRIDSESALWDVLVSDGIENTPNLVQRSAEMLVDGKLQTGHVNMKRFAQTLIGALKQANPNMNVPTRDQLIDAWRSSK